jgi:tRNA pseudouridine32 synthase/23S rRNA pseudouridine746 synthase
MRRFDPAREPMHPSEGDAALAGPPKRRLRPAVLHSDDSLLVIDKPAGAAIEPTTGDEPTLMSLLKLTVDARAAYDMDVQLSGVASFAVGAVASAHLAEQERTGALRLVFLALVRASRPETAGTIDLPLSPVDPYTGRLRVDRERGRPARTDWSLRDAYAGYALLECHPQAASHAQVRAHLLGAGMPLVVDTMNGGGRELRLSSFKADYRPSRRHPEQPLIHRLSLHVERVELAHPGGGGAMSFSAAPPRDLRAATHQLAKFGRLGSGDGDD